GGGGRPAGAQRDGAVHRDRLRAAARAVGPAQEPWAGWLHLLYQPHVRQGPGPVGESVGVPAVPLVRAAPPGDHPGRGLAPVRARKRTVLPFPPARLPARRVGEQAVVGDRLARRARRPLRADGAALAGGHDRADAQLLGRLPAPARRRGVLAGQAQPAARPSALPPPGNTLDHGAPRPLTWSVSQPR